MKTSIKTLACAAAVSALLLACGDTSTNSIEPSYKIEPGNDTEPGMEPGKNKGYGDSDTYKSMEGYKELDQLAPSCKSEQKNLVIINEDTKLGPPPDLHSRCIGLTSDKEIDACKDEGEKEWEIWRSGYKKSDLPIPCVAVEGGNWWGAWLTDEEVAELVEKYGVSYDDGTWKGVGYEIPFINEIPIMNSRVISYQRYIARVEEQLGDKWYENGIVTDKEILKLWFPNIFNDEQAESKCNYFALHFVSSSTGLSNSYNILSQDMVLYTIGCTKKDFPGLETGDFSDRAMLICDDKDWKLKESINLDSWQHFSDPNWECRGGGFPNWEEIYF
jgi:hypothetical protein